MERWELERKRSKSLRFFSMCHFMYQISKRNQRLTERCAWPSIAFNYGSSNQNEKNAWVSKPDECSKYMPFTTQQIQSNITIPFRRQFVGYTNSLLFYEKPKATPFQKLKPLSSALNQNLETPGHSVFVLYIHSICFRVWMLYVKHL